MKFLLIRNDNIGDLACTTPLLELLRKAYPEEIIDFLGNQYNIDLLRHDPRISHLWIAMLAAMVRLIMQPTHSRF